MRNLQDELVNVATTGGFYLVENEVHGGSVIPVEAHLGYTHSDGLTITPTFNTVDVTAFEGGEIVKSKRNGGLVTYEFAIIQAGDKIRSMYYSGTKDPDRGSYSWDPNVVVRGKFVFDIAEEIDGETVIVERHYIPRGEVTALRAISVRNGEPVTYGVTVTARKSEGRCVDVYTDVTAPLDGVGNVIA